MTEELKRDCTFCGHSEVKHHPTRTETWCIEGLAASSSGCKCPGYNPNSELRVHQWIKSVIRGAEGVPTSAPLTEDQAVINFNKALVELAIIRGQGDEGDMASDWVLVADINNLDGNGEKDGYYNMSMRLAPAHISKGLLQHGIDRYRSIEIAGMVNREDG